MNIEVVQNIQAEAIMAIVRVETKERAKEIAQGCLDGGVSVLEISYTLPNAGEMIAYLKETFDDQLTVGAGTVLDSETARAAILAGAEFIIAPNFNKEVAFLSNRYQIPYAPGCSTISEMVEALEYGAAFIKLFPVAGHFGPSFIKTIKTPLPNMPILSSGGVTLDNMDEWFQSGADCLGIGSLLTKGTSKEIAMNAEKLVAARDRFRNKEKIE
ncbi:ketohydroxyglutarate aldolase [Marinilactibacillus kalidii]|uniref:ketohydroxyglutarate aldolase n=1 Tax=Marinilactibacillus kalidii TaxID=2820274 RepID=UPI001ABDC274|nr:ketohydroxyglutarate aldolase [Marinilactibacillus kalidii]